MALPSGLHNDRVAVAHNHICLRSSLWRDTATGRLCIFAADVIHRERGYCPFTVVLGEAWRPRSRKWRSQSMSGITVIP